ncbi:class I SAM-dependent methyltransferase [Methanoregula sp. UBA64]|jgi:SAM-dependent methyltransferase|uniref:class I SAM-dependent methyltransferase n=1 Tax=Methanoregula sp. UBA64 TaxID=1915554 RepID=UPI0025F0F2F5|nr:class I SAM-dependent methyltransferase [Methanoregula sp. UBA64]
MPAPATNPWETEYARKGRVWGGAVHNLPALGPGEKVLELGCGNGKTFGALRERGCIVTGIDISASAAALCRHQVPGTGAGEVAVADACCLPFLAGAFDAVVAFHVIGHLPGQDRARAMEEIARVLRPGGNLYFSAFSREDFRAGQGTECEPGTFARKNGIATHYFTEDEVRSLAGSRFGGECRTHTWYLAVRGERFLRAEISGRFSRLYP